jgi:hypothetical protein
MAIQVLPDQFGINQALQGLGPVLGQALSNRFANQQKRSTAQNVAGLLNRPITSEQDATEFLQGAIGAGLDPREAFGLLDSMLKSRQAFQPDPVAELLGLGGESALQPSMGGDQFQRPEGISGAQPQDVTAPRSRLESLTDGELVTLQSSSNARMRSLGKAEQERRVAQSKEGRADRDFSYKRAEPQFKKIDKIRDTLPIAESALSELQYALDSGELDGWNQNYFASLFGKYGERFVTDKGAIAQTAIKEYLLNNISRVGGRPNQWIEQQISGALPSLGKSATANRAIVKMFSAAARRDQKEVEVFDSIVAPYENAGLPLPLGIDRLVAEEMKVFDIENKKQLAIDLAEIADSNKTDEQIEKTILDKVPGGTPITSRRAKILDEKYGSKSKSVARKLGYDVDAPSSDERSAPKQDVNPEPASEKAVSITPLSDEIQDDELDQAIAGANVLRGTNRGEGLAGGLNDFYGLLSSIIQPASSFARGMAEGVEGIRYAGSDIMDALFGTETYKTRPLSAIAELVLPEQEEGFINAAARRAGAIVPGLAMGGPGSSVLARSALGGIAGQTAEKAGFGPLGQGIAEVAGSSLPGLKGLKPTPKQQDTYASLKKLGLDDDQIAPILSAKNIEEGSRVTKRLAKVARKTTEVSKKLDYVQEGMTDAFGNLARQATKSPAGPKAAQNNLVIELTKRLSDMDAKQAKAIVDDMAKFTGEGVNPSSAIRLYRAINSEAGANNQLIALKAPIKDYLSRVDPILSKDFEILNKSYAQFSKFRSMMDAGKIEKYLGDPLSNIAASVAVGIYSGNIPLLALSLSPAVARNLAQKMLVDPRYKNISDQMANAVKRNNMNIARSAVIALKRTLAEDKEAEALAALNRLTDEDLKKILQED